VKLVGKGTDPIFTRRIVKISMDHSTLVKHVERVITYYVGLGVFVEVDLVLDPTTPIGTAHDIGESLQMKIERLEEVERCFVHVDHEVDHRAHDEHKKIE
jgi:divalent metal cation (Fe/Co/Zn/Cd) transporter